MGAKNFFGITASSDRSAEQIGKRIMVEGIVLFEHVTEENFNELPYLAANADVAAAVQAGFFRSGYAHYKAHGFREFRKQKCDISDDAIPNIRRRKLEKTEKYYTREFPISEQFVVNALSKELIDFSGISSSDNISSNSYSGEALQFINEFCKGMILDCGSGFRDVYYENVINYEIKDYPTTDVLGVAESLPFRDNVFDGIFSFAVLEHVKYPWLAAKELCRVLKPGGRIFVNVPFLQPLHGYPNHYFNMTHMGVTSLFEKQIDVESLTVPISMHPIWTLTWFLRSWSDGLSADAKEKFLQMSLSELLDHPGKYLNESYVTDLSEEKNLELASGTFLVGKKKMEYYS